MSPLSNFHCVFGKQHVIALPYYLQLAVNVTNEPCRSKSVLLGVSAVLLLNLLEFFTDTILRLQNRDIGTYVSKSVQILIKCKALLLRMLMQAIALTSSLMAKPVFLMMGLKESWCCQITTNISETLYMKDVNNVTSLCRG